MALPSATIRDFGGGWNVSDSDLNLNSKFQPVSENIVRGVDGSFSPRQGYALFADFKTGTETTYPPRNISVTFTATNVKISVAWAAHGFANGDHVTFSGFTTQAGVDADELNGTHGILVTDANNFYFYIRYAATATTTYAYTNITATRDTHLLSGNIIHEHYFNRRTIVFTDTGEIGTCDDLGVLQRIWGIKEANTLTAGLIPTRRCEHWSSATFKSTVIACNGYDKDKPIQINSEFKAEFLVDKATSSNAFVPRADYVVTMQGYVIFIRTEYGDPFVEFSAKGTDGTFSRDPNPADSVEVDLSMITSTTEPVLLGGAQLREKLYVAFYDKGMIGELGVYDSSGNHNPDFGDTISENGTISHRTMVSLGNDVFMADYAGVPSVTISQQSGIFVPVRLSELIGPAIQQHLSRLSEETLKIKAFAFFNTNDRSYMLFIPIYDENDMAAESQPFLFNDELRKLKKAIVRCKSHRLFEDSHIRISGAEDIGTLDASNINGVRHVCSVIDDDTFVIDLPDVPVSKDDTSGGGDNVVITPVNDETIGYVFEYNKEFKTRRWTRYRHWNFDAGCVSQRGKVFLAKGLRVYRMGDNEIPLYADKIGEYDKKSWTNNTLYPVGIRVRGTSGKVYICTMEHTSPATGSFADYRTAFPDTWNEYLGEPIKWALETPWSDMQQRSRNKINKYVNVDSEGTDFFTVSAFVNQIRNNPSTNELLPAASMQFVGGDAGGWGQQNPGNWGGSRRTREEKVWPFPLRGKLLRWRINGETRHKIRIISLTMYYKLGNIR